MAKYGPFKNAGLVVNGVDLSDHVKSLTVQEGADMLDESAMGDNTKVNRSGIKTWSIQVQFFQDFIAGSVNATMQPLVGAASVTIVARPTNGSAPYWSGPGVLQDYRPIGGNHGEELMAPTTFQSAGDLSYVAT